jgi:hypothetical protein
MLRTLTETGTKVVASASVPEAIKASATPCHGVLVMSPASAAGAVVNTTPSLIGVSSVDGANYIYLDKANFEGIYIPISDAAKLYVDIGTGGEAVNFAIFQA